MTDTLALSRAWILRISIRYPLFPTFNDLQKAEAKEREERERRYVKLDGIKFTFFNVRRSFWHEVASNANKDKLQTSNEAFQVFFNNMKAFCLFPSESYKQKMFAANSLTDIN